VLAHEGITAIEDPLDELGKLASGAKALMEALGARVNNLDDLEHFDAKNSPAIKAEVQMYERAMDRTHRLLDSLVKHGYAERQVAIQEQEAMLVAGVIRRVLAGLGLSSDQQKQAQVLLASEFRAIQPRPLQQAG
jgi:glutamyl-tRNA reductase